MDLLTFAAEVAVAGSCHEKSPCAAFLIAPYAAYLTACADSGQTN